MPVALIALPHYRGNHNTCTVHVHTYCGYIQEWYGMVWYGIDLFEFGISTVQCTTWEDPNDIDVDT